jgi:porin
MNVGKMHPNQYFMLNFYANDESRQFLNGSFDGNSVFQPAQGTYAPGFVTQVVPFDNIYVNAGIFDIADYPGNSFQNINDGLYWAGVEVGWTPNFLDAFSRYNVTVGTTNAGNESFAGYGNVTGVKQTNSMIGFLGQQQIGDWLGVFAEYGLGQSTGAVAQQEFSAGVSIVKPFGRVDDDFGIAYAWTKPNNNYGNEPAGSDPASASIFETFYRLQITDSMQLSPDLQVSFNPASGDGSPVVSLALRLKTQF